MESKASSAGHNGNTTEAKANPSKQHDQAKNNNRRLVKSTDLTQFCIYEIPSGDLSRLLLEGKAEQRD